MDDIILAVIKKSGVININELVRKTGFTKEETRNAVYRLLSRGKIDLILPNNKTRNACSKCPLNKICHLNGKGGVKIGIN